jgi:hypothetical protein
LSQYILFVWLLRSIFVKIFSIQVTYNRMSKILRTALAAQMPVVTASTLSSSATFVAKNEHLSTRNTLASQHKKDRRVLSGWMSSMLVLALLFLSQVDAFAQPTTMSLNQDVSGTYANTTMTLVGAAFKLRVQENGSGTSTGTRNWQFNSDGYFNQWGTLTAAGVQTLAGYNAVIVPNGATASGNFTAAAYNNNGRLPATIANNYYTYTIMKGTSYASQRMSVLETSYNPVTIDAVAQSAGANGSRTVTITTSGTPNAAENIFVLHPQLSRRQALEPPGPPRFLGNPASLAFTSIRVTEVKRPSKQMW